MKSPSDITPCVLLCKLDPKDGVCTGCLRTVDEIRTWRVLSVEDRMSVMKQLESRRTKTTICPKCKSVMTCDVEAGKSGSNCWCTSVQAVPKDKFSEYESCLCRTCISQG